MRMRVLSGLALVLAACVLAGCGRKLDVTMEELAQKAESLRPGANLARSAFCEKIGGEPYKTVTIGDRSYMYFRCSDGKVIVMVDAMLLKNEEKVKIYPGIRRLD